MKKKILLGALVLTMFAVCSCGNSKKDEASEYYQEELGMSEEEADELADELEDEFEEFAE